MPVTVQHSAEVLRLYVLGQSSNLAWKLQALKASLHGLHPQAFLGGRFSPCSARGLRTVCQVQVRVLLGQVWRQELDTQGGANQRSRHGFAKAPTLMKT